jgi:molecular chaperone DnaJ
MSGRRDYYEVLGVAREAGEEDIKRSYRKLAMKYHPDRNQDNKAEAEARFKECAEAYEVLSDPEKRRRYDQFGHDGVRGGHDFQHMNVEDIFSMFNLDDLFGGMFGGGRGRGGPSRGYDLEARVHLTLKEVAEGAEKTIEFEKQDHCEKCSGSGAKPGTKPMTCPQCGGQGRVAQQGFGGMFRMVTTCPNCRGRGAVIREHCTSCGGSGRQMISSQVTIKIPAGVQDGAVLRVQGQGEAGERGAPSGDLHVYIEVKEHPIFSRHANDLVCQVPISFTQAALGADIEVPTLTGTDNVSVPPGTQHGEVFKLKGKGLPDLRSRRSGDQLVQILVEIPRKLSEKQRQILRDFAATEDSSDMPQRKTFVEKLKAILVGESDEATERRSDEGKGKGR